MKKFVLLLTLSRVCFGPILFVFLVFLKLYLLALVIFIFGSISDFLDGWLARKYKVESSTGAILDPIADKIFVLFSFFAITLVTADIFIGTMSVIILAREFWVSSLREYTALFDNSLATQVTYLAKVKTAVQFFSIALIMLALSINSSLIIFVSKFLLFLATLISIKTALEYSKNAFSAHNQ